MISRAIWNKHDTLLNAYSTSWLNKYCSLQPWNTFKGERLNVNDYTYLLLYGLLNSLPLTCKKLINSKYDADNSVDSKKTKPTPLGSITSTILYWELIKIIKTYPSASCKFIILF